MDAEQQKGAQHHGIKEAGGTRPHEPGSRQAFTAFDSQRALTVNLREQVCDPKNIVGAYRRVRSHKGKPGVDGMTVLGLADWLRENGRALTGPNLHGGCRFRSREEDNASGGIPVAVDRLVQQMILQVLSPLLDPTFSNSSFPTPAMDSDRDETPTGR